VNSLKEEHTSIDQTSTQTKNNTTNTMISVKAQSHRHTSIILLICRVEITDFEIRSNYSLFINPNLEQYEFLERCNNVALNWKESCRAKE